MATDVASRGIHVQDIVHVINYDLPEIAENFIHRVGRTGRAGEKGVASTLITRDQRGELFQMERSLGLKMEKVQAEIEPYAPTKPRPKNAQESRESGHGMRGHSAHRDGGPRRGRSEHRSHSRGRHSHGGHRGQRQENGPRHHLRPETDTPRFILPGEVLQAHAEN